jgi:opacity protein-like surface antigen
MLRMALGVGLLMALSTAASAAVVRIDVTGTASADYSTSNSPVRDLSIIDDINSFDNIIAYSWALSSAEIPLDQQEPLTLATSGRAFFDGTYYFDCSGLLEPLCWGTVWGEQSFAGIANTFMANVSCCFGEVYAVATEVGMLAGIQRSPNFLIGSLFYEGNVGGLGGSVYRASFTSAQVSVIPLPASYAMLLGSVFALLGFKSRRRGLRHCSDLSSG